MSPSAGTRRLRLGIRIVSVICILASGAVLFRAWLEDDGMPRVDVADASRADAAHEELYAFFEARPGALDHGLLDLDVRDVGALAERLGLLVRLLEDDYLLEVNIHHRPITRGNREPNVFSLHRWIADAGRQRWRSRLLELLASEDDGVRRLASRAVGMIAGKIPECLAEEPFPGFDGRSMRAILGAVGGDDLPRDLLLASLVREALRRPAALRVWRTGEPQPARDLHLLVLFLRSSVADLVDEDMVDALLAMPAPTRSRAVEDWLEVLIVSGDRRAGAALAEALGNRVLGPAAKGRLIELTRLHGTAAMVVGLRLVDRDALPTWLRRDLDAAIADVEADLDERLRSGDSPLAALARLAALPVASGVRGDLVLDLLAHRDATVRSSALSAVANFQTASDRRTVTAVVALLDDPSFRIAHDAAAVLSRVALRWPGDPAFDARDFDPLPLELAADPPRFEEWKQRWRRAPFAGTAAACLDALASRDTDATSRVRRALAANAVWRLTRAGIIDERWLERHHDAVIGSLDDCDLAARGHLLAALATAGAPWQVTPLWTEYSRAFRRDRSEAREIINAIHRIMLRSSGEEEATRTLIGELARRDDASATPIHAFLVARLGAEAVDGAIVEGIDGRGAASTSNLIRFFPATRPPRPHQIERLIDLLGADTHETRLWALERLRAVAGGKTFGFRPELPPDDPGNRAARERWREETSGRGFSGD